ncbi:MAG: septal ring lytic transglycosylase RlpA family protein [Coriobacteriales bacterium]|nr:septal ring lytic transglycosylase RlpA family protein [Coriobacteriales bacterium]
MALSLFFMVSTLTLAFGDFVPVTVTKVLGVGRIQSTLPAEPVASEDKFALASNDTSSEQATELVVPIERETLPPETDAERVPETPAAEAPANVEPEPVVEENPWKTTLATNYATLGDGFLGKRTASGAVTTITSMGVAHKSLPLGTQVELYCPKTGLSCIATVNDRGPFDGRSDSFDFQMGVTGALGNNTGWYTVQYRIIP